MTIELSESASAVLSSPFNPPPHRCNRPRWAVFVHNAQNFSQVTPLIRSETGDHRVITVNPLTDGNEGRPSSAPGQLGPRQSRCDDAGRSVAGYGGSESEPVAAVALGNFHRPTSTALVNDAPQGRGRVIPPRDEFYRFGAKAKI